MCVEQIIVVAGGQAAADWMGPTLDGAPKSSRPARPRRQSIREEGEEQTEAETHIRIRVRHAIGKRLAKPSSRIPAAGDTSQEDWTPSGASGPDLMRALTRSGGLRRRIRQQLRRVNDQVKKEEK